MRMIATAANAASFPAPQSQAQAVTCAPEDRAPMSWSSDTASRLYARKSTGAAQCDYFVYRPEGEFDRSRLLVLVHGISRNVLAHVLAFRSWADRLRLPIVAPLFSREAYRRYQILAGRKGMPNAMDAFDEVIADAREQLAVPDARMFVFGYSGGGQFLHRYLFHRPEGVERAVIGAAGWYTFPDPRVAFPLGLAAGARMPALMAPAAIERYPSTLVVVGSEDRSRDESLNQDPEIDRLQGRHRRARARRWVEAMAAAARAHGREPPCRLHLLRGASHAFAPLVTTYALDRIVVEFLFEDQMHAMTETA